MDKQNQGHFQPRPLFADPMYLPPLTQLTPHSPENIISIIAPMEANVAFTPGGTGFVISKEDLKISVELFQKEPKILLTCTKVPKAQFDLYKAQVHGRENRNANSNCDSSETMKGPSPASGIPPPPPMPPRPIWHTMNIPIPQPGAQPLYRFRCQNTGEWYAAYQKIDGFVEYIPIENFRK